MFARPLGAKLLPPQLLALHVVANEAVLAVDSFILPAETQRSGDSPIAQVTKIRSPHTAGVELPLPGSFTFHATPSVLENLTG